MTRIGKVTYLLAFSQILTACSPNAMNGIMSGLKNTQQTTPQKLLIFGGDNHDTYLGCLNCSEFDKESITNEYGTYGSQYSSNSIFNTYGQYGSEYSSLSPCNPYATDPPVIVDGNGNFYGYLTVNQYKSKKSKNENINAWIAGVCAAH